MVAPLNVAFLGTPAFALSTLQRLHASPHHVAVVITQPDRPRGRGQRLAPSPVKAFALDHDVPVLQPERLKEPSLQLALAEYRLDLAVVAAYGRIIPAPILGIPRLGTINVHASLLPRWRGAAPIHRAIMAGDKETGVTIMRVVPALDAGPMLATARVTIGPDETSVDLERRLAGIGAALLVETVDRLAAGPLAEEEQDEAAVTYASRLERRESRVDWARPADDVHNQIRGLQPWPMATALFRGRRFLLLGSGVADRQTRETPPGTVVAVEPDAFIVASLPGAVRITRVQIEGRDPVAVKEFLHGHAVTPGDHLDPLPIDR